MLRLAYKTLRHKPRRVFLMSVAIVLATSFVSGVFVLTNAMQNSFDSMFGEIYGASDITVRPAEEYNPAGGIAFDVPTFDEAWVERVAAVEGVDRVSFGANGYVTLLDSEGEPSQLFGPPVITQSWNEPPDLDNISVAAGRGPATASEIVLDVDGAKKAGYEVGDTVTLSRIAESEYREYTLVGTVDFGASNALNGATLLYFTHAENQELVRQEGEVAQILLTVEEGYSDTEVQAALNDILPPDIEAMLSSEMIAEGAAMVADAVDIFTTFFLVFALIAMFVGAMLITNTFMTIVTQRTRELGLLRAIAASPRQITWMILLEALVIGVVASVIGIAVGYGLAAAGKFAMDAFAGMGENIGTLTIPLKAVVWGLATGVGSTVVAAMIPAIHAARITPMEALRDEATRKRHRLQSRTVVGLSLLTVAVVTFALALGTDVWNSAALVGIAGALGIVGTILASAALVAPLANGVKPAFRRVFGLNGVLAMNNVQREPRRTANTAGALMLGIVLLSTLTTISASLKSMVQEQIVGSAHATFVVQGDPFSDPLAPITDAQVVALSEVDGVSTVHLRGVDFVEIDGTAEQVGIIDPLTQDAAFDDEAEPSLAWLSPGEVYVDKSIIDGGKAVGDRITLVGFDETLSLTIGGVMLSAPDQQFVITFEDAETLHHGVATLAAWIVISESADIETVRTALEDALGGDARLKVQTTQELSDSLSQTLDGMLAFLSIMLGMSLVIAIFGVANTLFLSVTERTREIGLLRAVGIGRKAVKKMIRLESVFIAVLAALPGLALGIAVGSGLVLSFPVLADQGLQIPWTQVITYTILAVIAGMLAAIMPARRAAKLNILESITTE